MMTPVIMRMPNVFTLFIDSRGQVTLPKEVLEHFGIKPGEKIKLDLLPGGKAGLSGPRQRRNSQRRKGNLTNSPACPPENPESS